MTGRWLAIVVMMAASPVSAGETVLFAPAPAWVKPAPPIDIAKLDPVSPVLLMLDNQARVEGGQVWAYTDYATRAATEGVLGQIGTVQLPWQPAMGDLIVHKAEILRGPQRIDLLKEGATFQVLRREQQLDQRILDGVLTATMQVPGLQVGDVLHIQTSTTRRDPTLRGNSQVVLGTIAAPARVGFARARIVWPRRETVAWRGYADGLTLAPVDEGDDRVLTVALPLPKPADIPADAPARFQPLPFVEVSSFADWAQVASVMGPLYATEGLIAAGGPLEVEAARIARAESDPVRRAAAALQLVQDKLRYQLMGMETGNYVPQPPALSWSVRYGDCKAKTLMLLALLHKLGIEAEPVLANLRMGDALARRLPSMGAFDHIFVRATIGGRSYWLDGTDSGSRLADIGDAPALGYVLPVRASGATLEKIVPHAPARPFVTTTIDLDESAGIGLPVPFRAVMTFRGQLAAQFRQGAAQASPEEIDRAVASAVKDSLDDPLVVDRKLSFDDATGTASIEASGITYPAWSNEDGRMKSALDKLVAGMSLSVDRTRAAWRDIPVARGSGARIVSKVRVRLPDDGRGFTLEGDRMLNVRVAEAQIERRIEVAGPLVSIDTQVATDGRETAAADLPGARAQLALAQARKPMLVAPAGTPPLWQRVGDAGQLRRFAPLLAVYARQIATKPDKADSFTDRAWFYERIYARNEAIADLTRAVAISPEVGTYLRRASLYWQVRQDAKALADAEEAVRLDPGSNDALMSATQLQAEAGERTAAIARLDARIAAGGDGLAQLLAAKATRQADAGDREGALATLDAAIKRYPGKAGLLNARCWLKATLNFALDTALKDCSKAIEMMDSPEPALDSRALVYLRLGRPADALADLDAVLDRVPDQAGSLYLRGHIRRIGGEAASAATDMAGAHRISPRIDDDYKRWGLGG